MPKVIFILGPTAVGKTEAAIALAKELHTEILSCDSRQFYKELNIGVARPSEEELAAVPHHFIANRSVIEPYNVYEYEQEALALLEKLFQKHKEVIVVGGSGLYVDALCNGINLMPDPSPELRQCLSRQIAEGRLPDMLKELERLDPDYYAVVDHKNPIRIQRALEVSLTAGMPYSQLISRPLAKRPFECEKRILQRPKEELRERIERRVDKMIEQGLLDEVSTLLPYRHLNTLNTVGYKELFAYLDGDITLEEAIKQIKLHTWRYARKQMTWFKGL